MQLTQMENADRVLSLLLRILSNLNNRNVIVMIEERRRQGSSNSATLFLTDINGESRGKHRPQDSVTLTALLYFIRRGMELERYHC